MIKTCLQQHNFGFYCTTGANAADKKKMKTEKRYHISKYRFINSLV